MPSDKERLKQLLQQGKWEDAIEALAAMYAAKDDHILSVYNRYKAYQKDRNEGILNADEVDRRRTHLIKAALDITNDLPAHSQPRLGWAKLLGVVSLLIVLITFGIYGIKEPTPTYPEPQPIPYDDTTLTKPPEPIKRYTAPAPTSKPASEPKKTYCAVSGQVRISGKYVAGASVTLLFLDGKKLDTISDEAGLFVFDRIPSEYKNGQSYLFKASTADGIGENYAELCTGNLVYIELKNKDL